jgi:pilus assembly protein CpaE
MIAMTSSHVWTRDDRSPGTERRMSDAIPSEGLRIGTLSAVVVGSDEARRQSLLRALAGHGVIIRREFNRYPDPDALLDASIDESDLVVVDLDPENEAALGVVEELCSRYPALTVMGYSSRNDPQLLVRCMRAGTREFLTEPLSSEALPEALVRAASRRGDARAKRSAGRLLVFLGAKGGAGVTTVASNFAIALKEESGEHVAIVDANFRLGDVSVLLGITPSFTVLDALSSGDRMDGELISTLLTAYDPKLSILAGPDQFHYGHTAESGSIRKLLGLMRDKFPYIVVDGGSALGQHAETLFELADVVYLITQAEIAPLRNAQRILSQLPAHRRPAVEIVANRLEMRRNHISEEEIEKAIDAPLKWRLPDDYPLVRTCNDTGKPLILDKSALSAAIRKMACAACGKTESADRKKKFGLFGR